MLRSRSQSISSNNFIEDDEMIRNILILRSLFLPNEKPNSSEGEFEEDGWVMAYKKIILFLKTIKFHTNKFATLTFKMVKRYIKQNIIPPLKKILRLFLATVKNVTLLSFIGFVICIMTKYYRVSLVFLLIVVVNIKTSYYENENENLMIPFDTKLFKTLGYELIAKFFKGEDINSEDIMRVLLAPVANRAFEPLIDVFISFKNKCCWNFVKHSFNFLTNILRMGYRYFISSLQFSVKIAISSTAVDKHDENTMSTSEVASSTQISENIDVLRNGQQQKRGKTEDRDSDQSDIDGDHGFPLQPMVIETEEISTTTTKEKDETNGEKKTVGIYYVTLFWHRIIDWFMWVRQIVRFSP